MHRDEIPTPALLLDLDRFERNLARMAAHVRQLCCLLLHRLPQGGGPREEPVEHGGRQGEPALADPGEHVLQAVDVVLDLREPDHPAVALQGVQRAERLRDHLGVRPLALEREQAMVEGLEVLAGILEVDGEQLGRDLEVGRHGSRPPIGSTQCWS